MARQYELLDADRGQKFSSLDLLVGGIVNFAAPQVFTLTDVANNLILEHAFAQVLLNNAAANTLTVPTNANIPFTVGTWINVAWYGAGQPTIVPAGGVTIRTAETLILRTRYSCATLFKIGVNEWLASGDWQLA